jgi:hypothetical protein
MNEQEEKSPNKKSYPKAYEKTIPVLLVLVGLAIIIMLLVIAAVVSGIFPGS